MTAVSTDTHYHCPRWCEGHDEDSIEQTEATHTVMHCSGVGGGSLDRLANMMSGRILRDAPMTYDVTCYMTELESGVRMGDFVHLDVSDLRDHTQLTMPLTPGEARSLAAALVAAADRLDVSHNVDQHLFHRYAGRSQDS